MASSSSSDDGLQDTQRGSNVTTATTFLDLPDLPIDNGTNEAAAASSKPPLAPSSPLPTENFHRRNISWGMNEIITHDTFFTNEAPPAPPQEHAAGLPQTSSSSLGAPAAPSAVTTNDRPRSDSVLSQQTVSVSGDTTSGGAGGEQLLFTVNLPYQGGTMGEQQGRFRRNGGGSRIFELPNDYGVVNPLESEAETYLLRAIERADAEDAAQNEAAATTATNSVLGYIPDKAVDAAVLRYHQQRQSEEQEASLSEIPSSPSLGTTTSRQHRSSSNGSAFRKAASMKNIMSSPRVRSSRNLHRRKLTLDETLFGLTHAMDAIHAESILPFYEEPQHQEEPTATYMPPPSSLSGSLRHRANTLESYPSGGWTPASIVVPEGDEEEEQQQPQNNYYYETPPATSAFDVLGQNVEHLYEQTIPPELLVVNDDSTMSTTYRRRPTRKDTTTTDPADVERGRRVNDDDEDNKKDLNQKTGDADANHDDEKTQKKAMEERQKSRWGRARAVLFEEWGITSEMKNFIKPKRNLIRLFANILVVFIALPSLVAAAILFYVFDNPPTGILAGYGQPDADGKLINTNGQEVDQSATSVSYFLIFAGVRQIVTLALALLTQLILIDFLAIDRGLLFKFGSRIPLFIMQARGWPFVLFFWSVFDWALLAGSSPVFSHWLYFQNLVSLFNGSNPDGNLISSNWNHRILGLATAVSFTVAIKRFWIAIFLGRQTYYRYSDKVATLMAKMLLISQVAGLGRQISSPQGREFLRKRQTTISEALTVHDMDGLIDTADDDVSGVESRGNDSIGITTATGATGLETKKNTTVINPDDCNPYTGKLSNVQRNRITRLLGAWEEPNEDYRNVEAMSIESLMHFRRAITHLRTGLPFSASFGPAGSREDCVTSSQEVFHRLMMISNSDEVLNFEVLALLGVKTDGTLDQNKLMELIKLFRPDRDGSLSMVQFVRSVDKVYKEVRMLRASIHNSSKVDGQFETIFNICFYTIVLIIVLSIIGLDPFALFVSVSGLILGFAFMIGTASSKYFEGLLFILVRRPYGIGDCIHVSDPNMDTSYTGSAFWYVEDITLFSTQVRYFYTNERASLSNGSLASSRIINSSKSYNAGVYHYLKIPIDAPYEKVKIFHEALESFVRNRPREWLGLSSFRAVSVNAQLGYIEYMVCIDHRESWAYWTQVRTSQSDLMGFGVELAKKLDIVYKQPTLPIDLKLKSSDVEGMLANQAMPGPPMPDVAASPMHTSQEVSGPSLHRPTLSKDFQSLAAQFPHRTVAVGTSK